VSQLGDYFHIPTDAEVRQLELEAHQREVLRRQQYQQTMMQAQNAARNLGAQGMAGASGAQGMAGASGAQGMAGASGALGLGMATNAYQPQTWGQQLSPTQIRDVTRNHIANQVEKMAEEIGAPTLLHAVVLAIRTMEIPE